MITKEQFINSFIKEITIIRHLGTKVTAEMLEYRPHEKQRTMLELMNYLGHTFDVGVTANIKGTVDVAMYRDLAGKAPKVTLENFDSVMEEQAKLVSAKLEALSDADLAEEIEVFGRKDTRAMHMLNVMKWSVAYKMQLFLYVKANGNHDIGTSNLWGGMDTPPKA